MDWDPPPTPRSFDLFLFNIIKKLEKESVVCLMTALFLKNRFRWQTTDQPKAHKRAHRLHDIATQR